jgi:hypothetical protein
LENSRLITYPDIDLSLNQKFLIVDATKLEVAILIKQLAKNDPRFDFYFWNGEEEHLNWGKIVWDAATYVLVRSQSVLDLTNRGLDVKKVVRYNNIQELIKFIYER